MDRTDILISGGGVAGLTAAAAFGTVGFRVVCVDPAPPVTQSGAEGADLRTTAFLQPAEEVLHAAGLWERLAPFGAPLQIMRIVDAGRDRDAAPLMRDFNSADISDKPFGHNFPNWLLRREILTRLAELPNVDFRPGVGFAHLLTRETEAIVTLTDGCRIAARLLIAADGRNSPVRSALGIGVKTTRYGQKALVFAVTHPIPHGNVSTEIHRSGGPFTLVPLPDNDGKPASSVVWMESGPEILRLHALPEVEFETAMSDRSGHVLGPLKLASRRTVWPIISQIADRMTGPRTALMAEAAHVVPPIGAQGLNMSLADIADLLALAEKMPETLGGPAMLDAYQRARHADIRMRVAGIDLLNRASMTGASPLRGARMLGIRALHGVTPIRKMLMKTGLGLR